MKSQLLKHARVWKIAFVVAAIAAWASIPLISGGVKASDEPPIATKVASLVSPTGSFDPHGVVTLELYASGNRELEVEIEDVNIAQGSVLDVLLDGSNIGQIVLGIDLRGKLKLRTQDGQAVPTVTDGSTVEVRNAGTILVAGAFPAGGGTPTPTPTAAPNTGDLFAALSGPTLNGVLPLGYAQFELESSKSEFEVEVKQINLPIGTSLTVFVDNVDVGTITLTRGGEGELKLRSDRGQTVPQVAAGSSITINNGGAVILTGTFRGFVGPSPTPAGTPGPTPALGRSFEAHLFGSNVTPQVSTAATGEIKISLNTEETLATVFGEFHNLSSNPTGARIETNIATVTTITTLGATGELNGRILTTTFNVTPAQVQQLRSGLWSAVITSINNPAGEIRGTFKQRSREGDFDGDGNNDFAVYRPSTGAWYSLGAGGFAARAFGTATDKVVSGDYDGDGRTDSAVYRDVDGLGVWYISRSSDAGTSSEQFGFATDIPVRGDFDGDGRSDVAIYRPSNGLWCIHKSDNSGFTYVQFGTAEDKPVPMDVDGDGRDDIAVFRPSQGAWYWLRSSDGQFGAVQFGMSTDIPVPGDFDGDGKDDVSVFRPSNGAWYSLKSSGDGWITGQFGQNGDIPVPGNYDADAKADFAVFRPSNGAWYVLRSSDGGFTAAQFGLDGDVPVAAK